MKAYWRMLLATLRVARGTRTATGSTAEQRHETQAAPRSSEGLESQDINCFDRLTALGELLGSIGTAPEAEGDDQVRFLLLVARHEPELFTQASEQFLDDPRVRVLMDRRRAERRRLRTPYEADRRRADRRHQPDYWEDVRHHPAVIIEIKRPKTVRTREARVMEVDRRRQVEQIEQIEKWFQEGPRLIGAVSRALFEENESLRAHAEAVSAEADDVRRKAEAQQREIARLQAEIERLNREAREQAEWIDRELRDVERMVCERREKLGQAMNR